MKKLLSMFLALILIVQALNPVQIKAGEAGSIDDTIKDIITGIGGITPDEGFEEVLSYEEFLYKQLDDGTVSIVGRAAYSNEPTLTIPDTINGKAVSTVSPYAFRGDEFLQDIIIPIDVTTIGEGAFYQCTNLKKIVTGANVSEVSDYMCFMCTSLTTFEIPKYAKRIGKSAFVGTKLREAKISDICEMIDISAFSGCTSLYNVNIGNNVKTISTMAFFGCPLTSLTLGKNIVTIGDSAFSGTSFTEINLPDTVESIGNNCFSANSYLKSIRIPSLITTIPQGLFYGCSGLSQIDWNNVTAIEKYSLYGCTSLYPVKIPAQVSIVDKCTFCASWHIAGMHKRYDNPIITCDSTRAAINVARLIGSDSIGHANLSGQEIIRAGYWYGGGIYSTCTHCGERVKIEDIPSIESVDVVSTVTYTGKKVKPAVTVTLWDGSILDKKYYTLKYTDNKNVGDGTVTITFKGNYEGNTVEYFSIVPQMPEVKTLKAGKKCATLTWTPVKKQVTGYEVQYSTNKDFQKVTPTLVTINKAKTAKYKIAKLKKKKYVYVRIRSYKTTSYNTFYSEWSGIMKVKVK